MELPSHIDKFERAVDRAYWRIFSDRRRNARSDLIDRFIDKLFGID